MSVKGSLVPWYESKRCALACMHMDDCKSECSLQGNITWSEIWISKQQETESIERWEIIWGHWMYHSLWNHTLGRMLFISMFRNRSHLSAAICLKGTCNVLMAKVRSNHCLLFTWDFTDKLKQHAAFKNWILFLWKERDPGQIKKHKRFIELLSRIYPQYLSTFLIIFISSLSQNNFVIL